jgi:hypothetical protein
MASHRIHETVVTILARTGELLSRTPPATTDNTFVRVPVLDMESKVPVPVPVHVSHRPDDYSF